MRIVVITNESLKEELLNNGVSSEVEITWIKSISELTQLQADVYIDLLFEIDHSGKWQELLPALVIINSVEYTLSDTDPSFVRINAWPTLFSSSIVEASSNEDNRRKAEDVFSFFNKKMEWLPDQPGFVTPRVVSMIINEAFLALEEGVSTKQEMNTAMKLGTNYPHGPFEWVEKIGVSKIASLLERLSRDQDRYKPSSLLFEHESV
jgi:3-hydroxybutyryl-CoA dehydrogenase